MGFFSWRTQDTGRSIANSYSSRPTFPVYLVNPLTGESYREDNYEGYGVFGGKDFYVLLAEMNGANPAHKRLRDIGLDWAFPLNPKKKPKKIMWPVLVEHLENAKNFKGESAPLDCPYQGFFYD